MSGTTSAPVVVGGGAGEVGYGLYRPPFTAVQRQELEHQAMIYKYLVAGLPVPPDLVMPIRRSFDALSARFFHHPSLSYCSYYGKKFDPEPGRCRRTDGKKWRCSKDAHPDSKYCERHMHRGRNRSRKPVESSQNNSQSVSATAITHVSSSNSGSFQGSSGNGSFQNIPLYGSSFGTKMQMEPVSYGVEKEFRYIHGLNPNSDDQNFSSEASGSIGNLDLGGGPSSGTVAWRLTPTQLSSNSLLKQNVAFDNINTTTLSKQHCFFGSEIGSSPRQLNHESQQHQVLPFFSEWPTNKESWAHLDDDVDGSNKNVFSSTQLSISIPKASSEFSTRNAYSPNDA